MKKKKTKYTLAQKKAYYSGIGYRTAVEGKGINFKDPGVQFSFVSGWREGKNIIEKNPKKYYSIKRK